MSYNRIYEVSVNISTLAERLRRVYRFHGCIEHRTQFDSLSGHMDTQGCGRPTGTTQSPQQCMCLAGFLVSGQMIPCFLVLFFASLLLLHSIIRYNWYSRRCISDICTFISPFWRTRAQMRGSGA